MTLGAFLVFVIALIMAGYFGMAFATTRGSALATPTDVERRAVSVAIIVALGTALIVRDTRFGVDGLAYISFFAEYCTFDRASFSLSFQAAFFLINTLQLGSCNPELLIPSWVATILLAFACLPLPWRDKVKLGALALISMIGIELASNAMRQGMAASILMLGFAWFDKRHRIAGILIGALAVALHVSMGLALIALIIAHFNWRRFFLAFAGLIVFVLTYSALQIRIAPVDSLVYEITKYSSHDAEDLYIRILAGIQMALLCATTVFALSRDRTMELEDRRSLIKAMKVAITAIPFLALPFFGYRYIYAIYPVVLYLTRSVTLSDRKISFEILLVGNAVIALIWAIGSSFISQSSFVRL